jgi:hypothetical protein
MGARGEAEMTDTKLLTSYLHSEVEGLEALEFLAVAPGSNPLHAIELQRTEDGSLVVRVPGRPAILPEHPPEVRSALGERGFVSEDAEDRGRPWTRTVKDPEEAVAVARAVQTEVFGEKPDVKLDIVHGSHRAEHEARKKLEALRERVRGMLQEIGPCESDSDGDFTLPVADVHVIVAPRVMPGGTALVRVFCITNVGVNVTPELGLFLARLNFNLMLGRFALDTEHRSIWFDESLLGDEITEELLRFTLDVVATTADEWDDRLKQMFGGATHQELLLRRDASAMPSLKPGVGGYL